MGSIRRLTRKPAFQHGSLLCAQSITQLLNNEKRCGRPKGTDPYYHKSLNGQLRDELLNGEIFYSLKEAQIVIEQWWKHYNTVRPHSALGCRSPAPESTVSYGRILVTV